MPSSYTTSLRLTLPATGELTGTWGTTVNTGITELLDSAVAGTTTISTWGGAGVPYTLSNTDGAADEARKMFIVATGAPGEAKNVICPAVSKLYFFRNDTTGGFALTLKTSGGSGIAVPAGQYKVLYCNGTNVVEAFNSLASLTLGTALAASSGGTGQSTYTTGDLLYASGASALSKLGIGTNGQILTSTGTAPQWSTLSGVAVTTFSAGTTGFTPSTATSGAVTLAGTLATTNGGTGLTSFTSGGVVYASSSSALTTGSALTFDGTNLTNTAGLFASTNGSGGTGYVGAVGTAMRLVNLNSTGSTDVLGNADILLQTAGNNPIKFNIASTEQMRLTSTGLGIGTSSPAQKLHVNNTTGVNTYAAFSNSNATNGNYVGTAANGDGIIGTIDAKPLLFLTGAATRATLDASGNLGLGVTPSAWAANWTALQVGQGTTSLVGRSDAFALYLGQNWRYDGADKYIGSAAASIYSQSGGQHSWLTAPSGTAGNAITFTQAMTLDASGNLVLGETSTSYRFQIGNGTTTGVIRAGTAFTSIDSGYQSAGVYGTAAAPALIIGGDDNTGIWHPASDTLAISTAGSERLRLDSSGNLGIGTSSPGYKLSVSRGGTAGVIANLTDGIAQTLQITTGSGYAGFLNPNYGAITFRDGGNTIENMRLTDSGNLGIGVNPSTSLGTSMKLFVNGASGGGIESFYNNLGGFALVPPSTGAGMLFYTFTGGVGSESYSERMRLDSSGNLGLGVTPSAWQTTSYKVMQVDKASLMSEDVTALRLNQNYYIDSSYASRYIGNGYASYYAQINGNHVWQTAPSGTAGNAISFTQAMTLDASGNLGVGITGPTNYGAGAQCISVNGSAGGFVDFYYNGTRTGLVNAQSGTFNIDTTTGVPIVFKTVAVERMRLDTSGNLGLGVTPSAWASNYRVLQMRESYATLASDNGNGVAELTSNVYNDGSWRYANSSVGAVRYQANAVNRTHAWYTAPSGTAGNAISFTQAMTLDASGNLGLGTTSISNGRFQIKGANNNTAVFTDGLRVTSNNETVEIKYSWTGIDASSNLPFATGGTERARITSGGDFLVGTTDATSTSGSGLKVLPAANGANAPQVALVTSASTNSTASLALYSTVAAAYRFYVADGGTIYATNTTISAISDQRFKENVRDLDVGLNAIMALKPRKFDWKAGKGKDIKDDRGFIAQEFEQVFPDLIDEWKDPAPEGEDPYKSVRQDLIPVLVKAIQEQQAIIDSLKARLDAANL